MYILRFLLIFLSFSPLPAIACDTDKVREYTPIASRLSTGMLYVVDDCRHAANYLFGTVHLDDEKIKIAAQPAFVALKHATTAIFEIKNSKKNQQETVALMVLPPAENRTLSDIIGLPTFKLLSAEMQKNQPGFPTAMLERYRPWAASILLQLPHPSGDSISLDDRLQIEAGKLSIPVYGLESPAEQMDVFHKMTESEQITLLMDTLKNLSTIQRQNNQLKAYYLQGNLAALERLGLSAFSEIHDSKMRDYMRRRLITQRNTQMVNNLLPHLKNGRSFIAVGALHLPGQNGLLNQLEDKGFFIWPVTATARP